jgi:colicin import membrane protein
MAMAQGRRRHALVAVLGTSLMILGGCGASHKTEVKDSWMARVPEEQLGDVRQAQASRNQAMDEVTRADVAIGDAERALDVARRNVDAAKHRKDAEQATLKAAEITGQRASIDQAQAELRNAEADLAAARAHVGWREQNVEAWKAQKRHREREVTVADAELSFARYLALKQHGDIRAEDISEKELRSAISDARSKALEARRDADAKAQQAQQARVAWQQLRDQVRGYGGSGWNRR